MTSFSIVVPKHHSVWTWHSLYFLPALKAILNCTLLMRRWWHYGTAPQRYYLEARGIRLRQICGGSYLRVEYHNIQACRIGLDLCNPCICRGIGCIISEMVSREPLIPGTSEIDQLFKTFHLLGTPNDKTWELSYNRIRRESLSFLWAPHLISSLLSAGQAWWSSLTLVSTGLFGSQDTCDINSMPWKTWYVWVVAPKCC